GCEAERRRAPIGLVDDRREPRRDCREIDPFDLGIGPQLAEADTALILAVEVEPGLDEGASGPEPLDDLKILVEENHDERVVFVIADRREDGRRGVRGLATRLDLDPLAIWGLHIPTLLTEGGPLATVVVADDRLGDVADRIVVGADHP